jgi:hypothetical protein
MVHHTFTYLTSSTPFPILINEKATHSHDPSKSQPPPYKSNRFVSRIRTPLSAPSPRSDPDPENPVWASRDPSQIVNESESENSDVQQRLPFSPFPRGIDWISREMTRGEGWMA